MTNVEHLPLFGKLQIASCLNLTVITPGSMDMIFTDGFLRRRFGKSRSSLQVFGASEL